MAFPTNPNEGDTYTDLGGTKWAYGGPLTKWYRTEISIGRPAFGINPTSNDRHPLRIVETNPIVITDTDYDILLNLPSGVAPTITLPDPTTSVGRELHFKNYHSTAAVSDKNNVRNSKDYENITNTITAGADGAWSTLVSDGTYWLKLQSYPTTDT